MANCSLYEAWLACGDLLFPFTELASYAAVLPDAGLQKKQSRSRVEEHLEKLEVDTVLLLTAQWPPVRTQ